MSLVPFSEVVSLTGSEVAPLPPRVTAPVSGDPSDTSVDFNNTIIMFLFTGGMPGTRIYIMGYSEYCNVLCSRICYKPHVMQDMSVRSVPLNTAMLCDGVQSSLMSVEYDSRHNPIMDSL